MDEQSLKDALAKEGYTDIRVCPLPPEMETPAHTHDEHTVHVILTGELTITDKEGTKTYKPGDRVEFPAGTTHQARGADDHGTMIVGVKS
jgi:quercetin dioxygenase-like cupin family protein